MISSVRKLVLPLASFVMFVSAASAQTIAGKLYVEAGAGITHANGDFARQVRDSVANSPTLRFDSATYDRTGSAGGRVAIGWQFTPMLAAELAYASFGRHETTASATRSTLPGFITVADGRFRVSAVTLDAVGQLPLTGPLSASARIGVAMTEQQYAQGRRNTGPGPSAGASEPEQFVGFPANRQTRLHWGVGAQYALNPNAALVANYERIERVGRDFSSAGPDGGVRAGTFGYGLLSVGLRYTF